MNAVEALREVTAALENCLLHQGSHMTPADLHQRRMLCASVTARFGWADPSWRETDREIVMAAKDKFEKDGDLEIDLDSQVSHGDDNGAYVQCWKWFPFAGTKWDKEAEE